MHTAKLTVVIIDRCPGAYLQTCEGEWSAEKISRMVLTLYSCWYSVLTYSQSSMSRASFAYRFLESLEMGISLLMNRCGNADKGLFLPTPG